MGNKGLFKGVFNFSRSKTNNLGIDLGTANTLVCTSTGGLVLNEPSVVAVDNSTNPPRVVEVGSVAKDMIGRTPHNIQAVRPLRDGVIADLLWAETMLSKFIEKVIGHQKLAGYRPGRVLVGLPCGSTEVERRAVGDAAYGAGAQHVNLIPEPLAAAVGAGLPVHETTGTMIVDIGGGTTEIAVISMNAMIVSQSLRIAGDEMTESIQEYLKRVHNLSIGEQTAELLKIRLGNVLKTADRQEMDVRGLNLLNGLPATVRVTNHDIRECLIGTAQKIVDAIKNTLEDTPPELAADIAERGIVLAGGGALLQGLDKLIAQEMEVPVQIAQDPLACVVLGTERILNDDRFKKILQTTEYEPRY